MRKSWMLVGAALLAGCGGGEAEPVNETANFVADEPVDVAAPQANAVAPDGNMAAPAEEEASLNQAAAEEEAEVAEEAPEPAARAPAAAPAAAAAAAAAPAAAAPKAEKAAATARPASFAMCQACHTTGQGEAHRVGPNLFGVFGAKAGAKAGYNYSKAMQEADLVWTRDRLDAYLAAPRAVVPGTKMVIGGPKDPAKRKEIVDYLASLR